ncbi:MAG TPA: zinc ABC transporter substrate-binding protein [Gammaproteobacteria bacterium]
MARGTTRIILLAAALGAGGIAHADLRVLTCEPEWAALVETLGGDSVTVNSATSGLQDPHRIQARPSLMAQARRADLLVCTGADLEIGWLPLLLRQSANGAIQTGQPGHFVASDFVTMLDVPARFDRAEGDIHPYGNPHIHLDPRNIGVVAAALSNRLAELDPDNAASYQSRNDDFQMRWIAAIEEWESRAATLRGLKVSIYHKSWVYLFTWLGIEEVATLEPKPGVPPSGAHLAAVLARVQSQPVRAVIRAAYQDDRASRWLAERAGLPELVLPFTVGGSGDAGDLFALFDATIALLESVAD